MGSNLVQQHVQQQKQVAHLQDLRSGSLGLNGVPLSQVHKGDALRGSQQWAHPVSRQSNEANLVQQHVQQQQQVAHFQDLRSVALGLNGVPLSQVHNGDALRGSQQWAHPYGGTGHYGPAASVPRISLLSQDGLHPIEFSRGGSHAVGHLHGNGNYHNNAIDINNGAAGNWSRGGGGPIPIPCFEGGKFERGRSEDPIRLWEHVQQQQQVAHLQDLRSVSSGLNGVPLSQFHNGDALHGSQQWAHPYDGTGHYGAAASLPRLSPRSQHGMRPAEFSRGGSHAVGHLHGNGNYHNNPYDKNNRTAGNWSRGGGGGGGPVPIPRFKGGKIERGRSEEPIRSQAGSLRCDACDRTFKNSQQFTAHNNTHMKCDVEGCSFEASGRVVKEHKQSTHDNSASDPQVRSKFKSRESEEEIARWIEERKKHYPTVANIKQKAEEMKARKLRGELVDEDARKRRERLKEILAKQAELGVPVAEVPSYYMSDRYGSLKGKCARGESSGSGRNDNNRNAKRGADRGHVSNAVANEEEDKEPPTKVPRIVDGSSYIAESAPSLSDWKVETIKEAQPGVVEVKEGLETEAVEQPGGIATDEKNQNVPIKTSEKLCFFFKRGRCKKGNRCEFLHERRPKKKKNDDVSAAQPGPKRAPTLLAKLLESDIRREKSHLLQSFRFFVNNMFLLEFPEKPLKFFEWQESNDRTSDAEVGRPDTKNVQETENEDGTDSDEEDMQTSLAQEDSGELTRLEGEADEAEFETLEDMSDGETQDAEHDGVGTDEDMDTLHEEENRSEVETRSDGEIDF